MTGFRLHTHGHLEDSGFRHGWTDDEGPDFKVDPGGAEHARAVDALVGAAGLEQGAWARQVHGGTVLRVSGPGLAGEADALWSDVPGLGVVGRSADCPLILVAGRRAGGDPAWGFAHASWRSTLAGITSALLEVLMGSGVVPESVTAVVCPSAGPCCYEVGPEVRAAFADRYGPEADPWFIPGRDKPHLDLWRAARDQLAARGVSPARTAVEGPCTICGRGYPSHRREGAAAGRFAAVIGA